VGRTALGWLIYRWTEGVKRDVYWTYKEVGKVMYKQEELKKMLENTQKDKSLLGSVKNIKKNKVSNG
jgi:hypothetical protein